MKFLDQAKIYIKAGNGGSGSSSFRREKYVEFGGPDGGDGGNGGSVILESERNLNTLVDFRYRQHFKAENGRSGSKKNKTGAGGKNLILKVPIGTQIYEEDNNTLIYDLTKNNDKLVLNLAINYGSRNEIINAVKIISKNVKNNQILIDDINEDLFNDKLYTSFCPYPDLLIRTGGESRLSNFLLWQLAYSEIIINDSFWPDYKVEDLKFDINKFAIKERRFGKTSEQINF